MSDVRYRAGGYVADVAADGTILTGSVADDGDGNGEYQQHRANLHDLERIHPPESDDERAQRHERLALYHWQEFTRLTGKEPEQHRTAEIRDEDIEFRAWRRHDYGGQHVGVESSVIALHKPTGIAAISTDERSQMANKRAALERLTGAIVARKAESRLNAEDVARLRGSVDMWDDHAQLAPFGHGHAMADAIRTVLAKLEGR